MITRKGSLEIGVPSLPVGFNAPIVEIRDHDMKLIRRAAPGQEVTLDPGTYWTSATLPGGETQTESVEVLPDEASHVVFAESPADSVPWVPKTGSHEAGEWPLRRRSRLLFRPDFSTVDGLPVDRDLERHVERSGAAAERHELVPGAAPWSYRLVSGLSGSALEEGTHTSLRDPVKPGLLTMTFHRRPSETVFLQIAQIGRPIWNVALPFDRERGNATVEVSFRSAAGRVIADPALVSPFGAPIAQYLQNGILAEAALIAENAELMMLQKRQDPIGATLGGYALLRLGKLDPLAEWSQNLMRWSEWLPDGAILAGACAEMAGEFDVAEGLFDEAHRRGLPVFSDGLSISISHLRRRAESGTKLSPSQSRFVSLGVFANFESLLVNVPGIDPRDARGSLDPLQRLFRRGWTVVE